MAGPGTAVGAMATTDAIIPPRESDPGMRVKYIDTAEAYDQWAKVEKKDSHNSFECN
jgi:hypothetical protein